MPGESLELESDGELGLEGVWEAEGPFAGPLLALVGAMPGFRASIPMRLAACFLLEMVLHAFMA